MIPDLVMKTIKRQKTDMFDLTVSRLSTCSIASALGLCSIHLFFTREKLASLIHKDLKKQHTKDAQGMYRHCKSSLILNDGNTVHNVLCWRPVVFLFNLKRIFCVSKKYILCCWWFQKWVAPFYVRHKYGKHSVQFRRGLISFFINDLL